MNKLILITIALAVLIASNIATYVATRDSYRSVGVKDGRIELGLEIITVLKGQKKIQSCQQLNSQKLVSVLEIKSTSLRLVPSQGDAFSFCIYE